jgi:hypothetical protein
MYERETEKERVRGNEKEERKWTVLKSKTTGALRVARPCANDVLPLVRVAFVVTVHSSAFQMGTAGRGGIVVKHKALRVIEVRINEGSSTRHVYLLKD